MQTFKTRQTKANPSEITVEISFKLILSGVMVVISSASLARLLPYHFSQQTKLYELQAETAAVERRVIKLRSHLNHNFDSQQQKTLMQEYSPRLSSHQSRIFWLKEKTSSKAN